MAKNERFGQIMNTCVELHDRKSHDYAQDDNPYSNFEFAASVAGVTIDQVFLVMLGIKMARLKELANGKIPNNESVRDTHLDIITYAGIWAAWKEMITELTEFSKSIKDSNTE